MCPTSSASATCRARSTPSRARPESNGKVGVIGYCSGGRQSFIVACTLDVDAAVDCYGGRAPVELAPNLRCPLLGLFGDEDTTPSPDDVAALAAALDANGKRLRVPLVPRRRSRLLLRRPAELPARGGQGRVEADLGVLRRPPAGHLIPSAMTTLRINGIDREVTTHPRAALLWALRDELGLRERQVRLRRRAVRRVPGADRRRRVGVVRGHRRRRRRSRRHDARGAASRDGRAAPRRRRDGCRRRRPVRLLPPGHRDHAHRARRAVGARPTATTSCGPSTSTCAAAARTPASWPPPARRWVSSMS